MLLSAYSGSIAAAFAESEATLVSHWTFDETGGASFADSGPAGVPMSIVGTWGDLSTDSMVQGVGGTSAYTGNSGYATIPASDPDHDLSALTISFYYQSNSAAEKHILLAASDSPSTGVGDFSIEVLTNGRLRGFHVGQDATLRFFEGTNGVTGTNLHDSNAHRIDVSFGPAGAKIYLDGVPLTGAFIPLNTNGWNNARVKYLGRWIDGATGEADAAFDHFRIWGEQLSDAQIAALEAAQTITLPQPASVSVGVLAAFTRSTIDVTGLGGWPAGRTPKVVVQQGARASAYVRRAWKPSLNTGTHMDFIPGWQKTTATESIRLQLDDDSVIDLNYTVGHTIPSPTGGGVTRTLDRTGGGDFTTWASAVAALTAGDVLVVRAPAGTWVDSGGHAIPNYVYDVTTTPAPGAGVHNVTVVAHPDDVAAGRRPILWRNAGRYARFKYDAANAWQVHADLGGGNVIYQSVATSTQPSHSIFAAYKDQVNDWIVLYNYQAINDATDRSGIMHDTTYPSYGATNGSTYMGPSLIYNKVTSRFEVRLNAPVKQTYMDPGSAAPFPPWDWTDHYPASTDARNVEIVITDGADVGGWNGLIDISSRNGWKFYNLDFVYGNSAIKAQFVTTAPQFWGCSFLGGASPDFDNSGVDISFTSSGVLSYEDGPTGSDMLFDRCNLPGCNPPWGSWAEGKGFEGAFGLMVRRELLSWSAQRALFRYSKLTNWWHLTWMGTGENPVSWRFHHNYMRNFGMDGGLIMEAGGDVVANRNFCPGLTLDGYSTVGGNGLLRHISFNLVLKLHTEGCTFPNKNKWANASERISVPCYSNPHSIGHGGRSDYSDRKYHNTYVGSSHTLGVESFDNFHGAGCGVGTDTRGTNNRIFNCIGAVYTPPFAWPMGVGNLVGVYSRESGNNVYDHNLYYKDPAMISPATGNNTFWAVNSGGGAGTIYASLAAMQSGEGFDANSVQADPQFVVTPAWASSNPYAAGGTFDMANYLLGASSPGRTGGRNLNDQSFPDYDFETLTTFTGGNNTLFRGALDPSIPLVEQEVGIVGPAPPAIV